MCHYTECRYAECHYAECCCAECHYVECRGAFISYSKTKLLINSPKCYCGFESNLRLRGIANEPKTLPANTNICFHPILLLSVE